jgi:hypothetical protein
MEEVRKFGAEWMCYRFYDGTLDHCDGGTQHNGDGS